MSQVPARMFSVVGRLSLVGRRLMSARGFSTVRRILRRNGDSEVSRSQNDTRSYKVFVAL